MLSLVLLCIYLFLLCVLVNIVKFTMSVAIAPVHLQVYCYALMTVLLAPTVTALQIMLAAFEL